MARLKVAVLVPDGAADLPLEELGGRTPLGTADTPNMDTVASLGATGMVRTVPVGMSPGSDVANLSLLGYDPATHYGGRGPIEAANLGLEVPRGWTAFRCNLVATDGSRMLDYSAGHISQEAAGEAMAALEAALGDAETRFHQGKSYRNMLLLKGDYLGVECTPPHDITGERLESHMPRPPEPRITRLIEMSREVLAPLTVNERLRSQGKPTADMIWPWGQGTAMELEPFLEKFAMTGAVISAVDLVNGLGRLAGLRPIKVPGATGFLDTDYRGKGEAAARVLAAEDFVYVHVEAPDEASHMGDVSGKVKALERFDEHVVGAVLDFARGRGDCRLAVCPDHPTLISTRTHDSSPVPFAACGPGIRPSGSSFNEDEAASGGPFFEEGWRLMSFLTGAEPWPD